MGIVTLIESMNSQREAVKKLLMDNPGVTFTTVQINNAAGSSEGTRRFRELRREDYRFHSMPSKGRQWLYWYN